MPEIELSVFAVKVQSYYKFNLWDKARVDRALELKKLAQEEYNIIIASKQQ